MDSRQAVATIVAMAALFPSNATEQEALEHIASTTESPSGRRWLNYDFRGLFRSNQDIAERHRDVKKCKVMMVLGKAGRGKSSFIKALTGATHTSAQHVWRLCNADGHAATTAGERAEEGLELFKCAGMGAGDSTASIRASVDGAMTTETCVVETSFHERYCEDYEDSPLVVIDTPGINDAGCIPDDQVMTKADDFIADIIKNTLHVNNSYGGFDQFILTVDATNHRSDANAVACIRQLAHSFGCANGCEPTTDADKKAAEAHFMRNLSIVFTHSDRILGQSLQEMRDAEMKLAMDMYAEILYKNCEVARDLQVQLVNNVERTQGLAPNEIACYFVDNESVRVRQRSDDELEQEVTKKSGTMSWKPEVRAAVRQAVLDEATGSQQQYDLTCENIIALKRQMAVCEKKKFSPTAVGSASSRWVRRFREMEARERASAEAAERAQEEARIAGDQVEEERQRRIAAEHRTSEQVYRERAEFWGGVAYVTFRIALTTGATVGGFFAAGPVGAAGGFLLTTPEVW